MSRRGRFTRPQVKKLTQIQRKLPPALARDVDTPATRASHMEAAAGRSVLVIDDDPAVVPLIVYHLAAGGCRIFTARSASEGLAIAHEERPDLVIVGARLPDLPGTELLRRLRLPGPAGVAGAPGEPVAVLLLLTGDGDWSARQTERLDALSLGADDVLAPPLVAEELMLRVAAILRRVREAPAVSRGVLALGGSLLVLDVDARQVTVEDAPVRLTRTEFSVLHSLAEHAGRLCTRAQLRDALWGAAAHGEARTRAVDVQVSRLRVKLGPAGELIETVRGEGYRLRKPSQRPRAAEVQIPRLRSG